MKLLHIVKQCGIIYGYLQRKFQVNQPLLKRAISRYNSTTATAVQGTNVIRKWRTENLHEKIKTMKCNHFALLRTSTLNASRDTATITFVDRNGEKITVEADIGETLLDVAKDNDIDGVEGACGGTLACSTCHCIFSQEEFDRLELNDITEDELDMLDLAYGLTDTSRLVCALDVTEDMDGIEIVVPSATNDARDV